MFSPFANVKLTGRDRVKLEVALRSEIVEEALKRDEQAALAKRRELIAQIKAMPAQSRQAQAAAEKRVVAARARLEAAEAELPAACAELLAASQAAAGADPARAIAALEHELRKTSDPRLSDAWGELDQIAGIMSAQFRIQLGADPAGRGAGVSAFTNTVELETASLAINAAKARTLELALAPLTRAQVTAELHAMIETLRPPLEAIDLEPFGLDAADDHEVVRKAPRERAQQVTDLRRSADAVEQSSAGARP